MIGALLGDMIGAPYEFDRGDKTKAFPLFSKHSRFTDDSVMTIAVAEALLDTLGQPDEAVTAVLVASMQKWGAKYPYAGYGCMFSGWLEEKDPQPYGSFGNGSAMRVSVAGWLYDDIETTRHMAALTASVTHNHPEGIKGAEATASAIFLARTGSSKEEIKQYIMDEFGYDLSRTCDEIRPNYHHVESCQETVPEAITAFLEGENFEDVIRTAVSLGGDCDTLTCIAGGIAEAFYGVPDTLIAECKKRLTEDIIAVLDRFEEQRNPFHDVFLDGNEQIEAAIAAYYTEDSKEAFANVLENIRQRMYEDGHFIVPVLLDREDENQIGFRTIHTNDGKEWFAVFTSQAECKKGEPSATVSYFIDSSLQICLQRKADGCIINPFGQSFILPKDLIAMMFQADGGLEYAIPDEPITEVLLADGSFLKNALAICNRNRTQRNLFKLTKVLRDSMVWVPCNAVLSDVDNEAWTKTIKEAQDAGDSLIGQELTNQDNIRMVPDILQNGDEFFLPVFTAADEMGEYGEHFSKIQTHFLGAVNLAKNNARTVSGIVINAFTEPFLIPAELFALIAEMESIIEGGNHNEND